jgi:guanylate kinase
LSRSWTTRSHRAGEPEDAYVFTTREAFEARIGAGGFLEWTDFLGSYYGTPTPSPPPETDVVLEIEVDGAQQIRRRHPEALLIFVLPPTREEQRRRLEERGDAPERVAARLRKAEEEEPVGKAISDYVVVNDRLDHTVGELVEIIAAERDRRA